ncbi:hypothetical protein [Clostridium sp. UBA6640]|uniref:hypothetical protein n=1 Tax=Clostridium sp. UBA6640 TaxID=1946370 RepID=UPI0025C49873|nr:hypothetical protein [Clostridium sp. UBA6640]
MNLNYGNINNYGLVYCDGEFYEDFYLYIIDLNNKELNNLQSYQINIINNEIWFVSYEDSQNKLYKMNLDGSNLALIE